MTERIVREMRAARPYHNRCCGCGGERDRPGQRYCKACHNAAQREYRARLLRDARAHREGVCAEAAPTSRQHLCARCDAPIDEPSYCNSCKTRIALDWRKEHPLEGELLFKANARSYANACLNRGQIARRPCAECGAEKAEMHHEDYARPLHVRWLCRSCHMQHHKKRGVSNETPLKNVSRGTSEWPNVDR